MNKNIPVGHVVVEALLGCGALKINVEEPFTLRSGRPSPVYFDCRRLIGDPVAMSLVTGLFHSYVVSTLKRSAACRLRLQPPDVILGGESAGIPFAVRLSAEMRLPCGYVRKTKKSYGTRGGIEGVSVAGLNTLLVEDLITDGGSKLEFIESIKEAGGSLDLCFVVFDRQQGGEATLREHGVKLVSLANIDSFIESGLAPKEVFDYFDDPDEWAKKFREEHPDRV